MLSLRGGFLGSLWDQTLPYLLCKGEWALARSGRKGGLPLWSWRRGGYIENLEKSASPRNRPAIFCRMATRG